MTPLTTPHSILPLVIVLIPLLFSMAVGYLGKKAEHYRNVLAVFVTGITFLLAMILYLKVSVQPVGFYIDTFLGFGLNLCVDSLGAFFTLLSSFIWFLATVFSWTYMSHEQARSRYYFFLLLTEAGCLGVFLTGDLFSLFFFFELMSLASYPLVVHAETKEAMDAGQSYLFLGVAGGLSLLLGIILLNGFLGTVAFQPLLHKMYGLGAYRYLIAGLLLVGFGIKAGMAPLHIWLPKAHPVAPSPASALLSGIMIKTGAYGILRVAALIFTPPGEGFSWSFVNTSGFLIIWLGIVTMSMAAFIALFQSNIKRILAYSSVSQMGYMLMGIGCAAYLGLDGPVGFSGSVFHILNHAFFKAGMFMMVGAVYARTHRLQLTELGGLKEEFPVTAFTFLIAACGIAGVPGFNGYASKTLLHHALVEAFHHGHVSLWYAEKIFVLTSACTVCYILKLYRGIFLGKRPYDLEAVAKEPLSEKIVFGAIAFFIVCIGLFPQAVLAKIVLPLSRGFIYDHHALVHLTEINFWTVKDLLSIVITLGIGVGLNLFLSKRGLFNIKLPGWLSIELLIFRPVIRALFFAFTSIGDCLEKAINNLVFWQVIRALLFVFTATGDCLERAINSLYMKGPAPSGKGKPVLQMLFNLFIKCGETTNKLLDGVFVKGYRPFLALSKALDSFDNVTIQRWGGKTAYLGSVTRESIYSTWMKGITLYLKRTHSVSRKAFFALIKADYDTKGDPFYQMINPLNYNFDLFVVWSVLLIILILGLQLI